MMEGFKDYVVADRTIIRTIMKSFNPKNHGSDIKNSGVGKPTPEFHLDPGPLGRANGAARADIGAGAAIDTRVRVDDVLVSAFADRVVRAFAHTGAATDAIITNDVSHENSSSVSATVARRTGACRYLLRGMRPNSMVTRELYLRMLLLSSSATKFLAVNPRLLAAAPEMRDN
jgi:hypothetical protein